LRINKGDADNRVLVWDQGPDAVHEREVRISGMTTRFRIWWKSDRSTPYLQAYQSDQWSFNGAYDEVQRFTGLPLQNEAKHPDKVEFDAQNIDGTYNLHL
jgi:hypothetical protein